MSANGSTGYYETPRARRIDPKLIPQELRDLPRWVVWKTRTRKTRTTKIPFRARNPKVEASSTDPKTWATFDEAMAAFLGHGDVEGIGFVLAPPYGGADFDNILGPDGSIAEWGRAKLERFKGGWAAISPSGKGIKVIVKGTLGGLKGTNRRGLGPEGLFGGEAYDSGRFFTITSDVLDCGQVAIMGDHSAELQDLHAELAREAKEIREAKRPEPKAKRHVGTKAENPPVDRPTEVLSIDDDALLEKIRRSVQGPKFIALYDRGDTAGYPSASEADFALMCILAFWCRNEATRIRRLFDASALGQREKSRARPEYVNDSIANAIDVTTETYAPERRKAARKAKEATAEKADALPDIEISTKWHIVVDEVVKALGRDPALYYRGSSLVTVTEEDADAISLTASTALKHVRGSPKIVTLSNTIIGCFITRNASLYQWKTGRDGEPRPVDCNPPDWLNNAIATLEHWKGIRPLLSVAECPYMRPDGTIVEQAGYDPTTATLYRPSMKFLPVPDRPTQADARAAWERIKQFIRQFPFPSEDDRAAWLAGLLTAVARPAIEAAVPGLAVIGNKASTGKGLLIDLIGIWVYGRRIATSCYPYDKEEAAKVKVAIALSGKPLVHFDNLDEGSTYGNSALDSALTSPSVDDRILGMSKTTGDLVLRVCWFLSGNNIMPAKDAYRRWLVCNLVSELERPEERSDLEIEDLRGYALEHRAEIVRDALTILRAHAIADRPRGDWGLLGSFEQWDRIIRGAVWFATGCDCCAGRRKAADESPARLAKIALLEGWRELPEGRGEGHTAAEAIKLVEETPGAYHTLRGALQNLSRDGKLVTGPKLGCALRAMKDNTIEGMKLVDAGVKHRTTQWRVDGEPTTDQTTRTTGHDEGGHGDMGGHATPPTRASSPSHTDVMMMTTDGDAPDLGGGDVPHPPMSPREVGEL